MKKYKFEIFFYLLIVGLLFILVLAARGQQTAPDEGRSSGGSFTITKAVVAGGGNTMQTGPSTASGTAGQTVGGNISAGGQFRLHSGFWTPDDFTPTAATASAGGRVLTADGAGIRNVVITMTFPSGETRTARSAVFGYYSFPDISVGETYIFTVSAKSYMFSRATIIRSIENDTTDIDFNGVLKSGGVRN